MLAVATNAGPFPTPTKPTALPFDDDDGLDGATSAEHSRDAWEDETHENKTFAATVTTTTTVQEHEQEQEDDDDDDDAYDPNDEDEESDSEDSDNEAYVASLEAQLDEHADEVGDYYLRRMLEKRATLEGDEAAWVDSYIERQRQWKETHGTSIDEMDLDLIKEKPMAAAWHGRVSSALLPRRLRDQPTEFLASLVGVGLFVVIALAVQFYVAFRAPLYS